MTRARNVSNPEALCERLVNRTLERGAGKTWLQFQELLDRRIESLGVASIDAPAPTKGEHILDIGCACGQTSLALAHRVGPTGCVVGVEFPPQPTHGLPSAGGVLMHAQNGCVDH